MKYAVRLPNGRYACLCGCVVQYQEIRSTNDRTCAASIAATSGGRVVRVLSHDEAKRKAAAVALLKHAEWCRNEARELHEGNPYDGVCDGLRIARMKAEEEAEALWPPLFHAGDGKKPRRK